jgi:3-mercaptopyruvate sulfurtransferase SseA
MGVRQAEKAEIGLDSEYDGDICPECGKGHVPNAVTLAAMQEAEAIARGEIPGAIFIDPTQYRTREELKTGLKQALQS